MSAQAIPGLDRQAIIQIEILDGEIHVYPQRAGDTVIYNYASNGHAKGRPREVRWVVRGLEAGQVLRIRPKQTADPAMFDLPGGVLEVRHPANTVTSGCPQKPLGHGVSLVWNYAIGLYADGVSKPVAEVDPGIIIKDYP